MAPVLDSIFRQEREPAGTAGTRTGPLFAPPVILIAAGNEFAFALPPPPLPRVAPPAPFVPPAASGCPPVAAITGRTVLRATGDAGLLYRPAEIRNPCAAEFPAGTLTSAAGGAGAAESAIMRCKSENLLTSPRRLRAPRRHPDSTSAYLTALQQLPSD